MKTKDLNSISPAEQSAIAVVHLFNLPIGDRARFLALGKKLNEMDQDARDMFFSMVLVPEVTPANVVVLHPGGEVS